MKVSRISVIGSGISGMIAASAMAQNGYKVDIFEKNAHFGGRIRQMNVDGFTFDMGPSWYWMPDIIEDHFRLFSRTASDFYDLVRLDPSYTVFWKDEEPLQVPAEAEDLSDWFESREAGSSYRLKKFLEEAGEKYRFGMKGLAYKSMQNFSDYLDIRLVPHALRMDLFKSMDRHLHHFFSDPKILTLLGFPVLFLGGTTRQIPALYSLMNFADMKLGTWYPMGGMYRLSEAWYQIAKELGVNFHFEEEVCEILIKNKQVTALQTDKRTFPTGGLIATGDYHHVEQDLLPENYRSYTKSYWENRTMSPSSLLFFVGVGRKLPGLTHHNLFFDEDLQRHSESIYTQPKWPEKPLFYVCCPSKTDSEVAPTGCENLFLLIPVAPGLKENPEIHDHYFSLIMKRLEEHLNLDIQPHILFKDSFGLRDFEKEYHSFKGNAYGLANTLKQTAILKPSMRHPKISNMVYAGQLTVPGPGIPPSMISGHMAANMLINQIK